MTDQERVARRVTKLEGYVRGFEIVVAGGGNVEGGFSHLPMSESLEERITHLENAVRGFKLAGDGLSVVGSFTDGYTVG